MERVRGMASPRAVRRDEPDLDLDPMTLFTRIVGVSLSSMGSALSFVLSSPAATFVPVTDEPHVPCWGLRNRHDSEPGAAINTREQLKPRSP